MSGGNIRERRNLVSKGQMVEKTQKAEWSQTITLQARSHTRFSVYEP